jgi:hypothetical protein
VEEQNLGWEWERGEMGVLLGGVFRAERLAG